MFFKKNKTKQNIYYRQVTNKNHFEGELKSLLEEIEEKGEEIKDISVTETSVCVLTEYI